MTISNFHDIHDGIAATSCNSLKKGYSFIYFNEA